MGVLYLENTLSALGRSRRDRTPGAQAARLEAAIALDNARLYRDHRTTRSKIGAWSKPNIIGIPLGSRRRNHRGPMTPPAQGGI